MNYTPKTPDHSVNSTKESSIKEFALLASSLIALTTIAFLIFDAGSSMFVTRMSSQTEAVVMKQFSRLENDALFGISQKSSELEQLVSSLRTTLPHWQTQIKSSISCMDQVNAVALPNGHLLILNGLLTQTASEEELAFVVAHELGHFYHRHVFNSLGRGILLSMFLSFVSAGESQFSSASEIAALLNMKFSRNAESEADKFALEMVYKTYGHTAGATDFFKKIEAKDPLFFKWASTHPTSKSRIKDLEQLGLTNHWPIGQKNPLKFKDPCKNKPIKDAS